MAVTLSVGLHKKIGQPDYGSLCASCHVDFEIDRTLLDGDLDGFHQKVRGAFVACQQSVEEQLSCRQVAPASPPTNGYHQNGHHSNGNGQHNGNGSQKSNGRLATASQVRAIHAIANKARIDLPSELSQRFGFSRPDDLTLSQASELIDAIKPKTNGVGGRR